MLLPKQKILGVQIIAVAVGTEASIDKYGTSWIDEVEEEGGIKDEFKVSCLDD